MLQLTTPYNQLESAHIGFAGSPSEQWKRYEQLKLVASDDDLLVLTDYPNAVVRCYAFMALATTNSDKTFKALLKHVNDTLVVQTFSGCLIMDEYVGSFFMNTVNNSDSGAFKLTSEQRKTIERIQLSDKVYIPSSIKDRKSQD